MSNKKVSVPPIDALRSMVEYLTNSEAQDWHARGRPENHIYHYTRIVAEWLETLAADSAPRKGRFALGSKAPKGLRKMFRELLSGRERNFHGRDAGQGEAR
jgi:hypothetical protein